MILQEIRLQAKSLFPLCHFYREIFELPVNEDSDTQFTVHAGLTKLIFEKADDLLPDPIYHFAFNIPSNRIHEAHDWLKEKTELLWIEEYQSYIADFTNWNAQSVYFLDPAGNIAELIARADLNDIIDEAFSSGHIRMVSELGLVFPESAFKESIELILKNSKLEYFNKQPPLEKFCAIGNDEGLFIIVPEHRCWYPSKDRPAGIFPMKITFLVGNVTKKISLG
ncbi:MAG TPA: hypothetical protein VJ765_14765 [Chitinophagaceae bacterium]|nr:hypothetical protein [Chitinophagaceae bacterium]